MEVCHKCDMPMCLNVAHLFLETHVGNMADMVNKNRQRFFVGVQHPLAKLNEAKVLAIRTDPRGDAAIAAEYNISTALVYAVRHRRNWRHV